MKRILILIHVLFCGYICPLLAEDTGLPGIKTAS